MSHIENSQYLFSFLSGGIAGIAAKSVVAPFDRIKILYQTTKRPFTYKDGLKEAMFICKTEGVRGLWRGNIATILQIFPFAAIQFAAFDFMQDNLKKHSKTQTQRNLCNFISGSVAGIVATFFTYPAEFIRTRMAIQRGNSARLSIMDTIKMIHAKEGSRAFYRGMLTSFIGMIPYKGSGFLMFYLMKDKMKECYPQISERKEFDFVFGAVAGFFSQLVSYPLDTVRKKMQVESVLLEQGVIGSKKTVIGWSKHIIVYEGIRGLFKGLTVNMIKGPLANGACFGMKNFLHKAMDNMERAYAI